MKQLFGLYTTGLHFRVCLYSDLNILPMKYVRCTCTVDDKRKSDSIASIVELLNSGFGKVFV